MEKIDIDNKKGVCCDECRGVPFRGQTFSEIPQKISCEVCSCHPKDKGESVFDKQLRLREQGDEVMYKATFAPQSEVENFRQRLEEKIEGLRRWKEGPGWIEDDNRYNKAIDAVLQVIRETK